MVFSKDSQLVKTWVRLVREGIYERDMVPSISNLQEVVWSVLDEK